MKKLLSMILCVILVGAVIPGNADQEQAEWVNPGWNQPVYFTGMSDKTLLPYIEDTIYSDSASFHADEYLVQDVSASYVSQEYLDELEYNSLENTYFGYKLSDLNENFAGTKYVFTPGENGETSVMELETVEDTTVSQLLRNVAIGTGVILVCVTVSAATSPFSWGPAVSMIFATAAKTSAACGLSGGLISGITAAIVRGIQTGDMKEALRAAAQAGGKAYKWGAIAGAVTGGAAKTFNLHSGTKNGLSMNQVARMQKESGYSAKILRECHSEAEYKVYRNANLQPRMVNKRTALIRKDIDLNRMDEFGRTNVQRMEQGLAPLDSTGKPFELHHVGQKDGGTLAILTQAEHDTAALHYQTTPSEINRPGFDKIRKEFWKAFVKILLGGI